MRCHCYFQPPEDLRLRLENEPYVTPPKSGLHCTIWGFNIEREREQELIAELGDLVLKQFTVRIIGTSELTDAYALRLNNPPELQRLHDEITRVAIRFDKDPRLFNAMLGEYGREHYNPHIQISKHRIRLKGNYTGYTMPITEFILLKREISDWQKIKTFGLIE